MFSLFAFLSYKSFSFNENFNGVFKSLYEQNVATFEASGSRYCWDKTLRKDIISKPEYCIDPKSDHQWCSNFDWKKQMFPYIQINFKNSRLALTGYSLQAGCCEYSDGCCCTPFSWDVTGSNDNKTWTLIHRIEKNEILTNCANQSFQIPSKSKPFRTIRLQQTDVINGCPTCIDLVRFEVYGDFEGSDYSFQEYIDEIDSEDEVSIIGKISHGSE